MDKETKDYKKRKKIGQFFTEERLADKLIKVFDLNFNNKTIVEPSCGDGVFIRSINKQNNNYKKIIGIDIDEKALSKIETFKNIILKNENFMSFKIKENIDMIIGNPPFNLKMDGYVDSTEGFLEKSINILSPEGEMVLIIPSTVLRTQKYQRIREKILQETRIVGILNTKMYKFLGADIETLALYLKKEKVNKQEYFYEFNEKRKYITLEKNIRDTILLNNKKYFNDIERKLSDICLNDLFEIRRGQCKSDEGLRGRDLDFYNDLFIMKKDNNCFIALQNIAYRITANTVKGSFDNVSDTVTLLMPKKKMSINEMQYITNYLNSSIAYYNLHINCLNNSKLTTHIDKYYINDMKIPNFNENDIEQLEKELNKCKRTVKMSDVRNQFFIDNLKLNENIINEVNEFWTAPKFKLKVGIKNGL